MGKRKWYKIYLEPVNDLEGGFYTGAGTNSYIYNRGSEDEAVSYENNAHLLETIIDMNERGYPAHAVPPLVITL